MLATQRGKLDEALAAYQQAQAAAERVGAINYFQPKVLIGEILLAQKKTDEALKLFAEVEALRDANPALDRRNSLVFAQVHTRHGDVLRESIKAITPTMPEADRAVLQEAVNHYTAATDIAPDFVPPKVRLASLLIDTNFQRDALQQLNEVFRIEPNNPDAKLLTAIIAEKQSQFDVAYAQLQNLLQTRVDYLPAHLEMAKVLLALGRVEDAVTELTNTSRAFPRSDTAKQMLADLKAAAATQPGVKSPATVPAK